MSTYDRKEKSDTQNSESCSNTDMFKAFFHNSSIGAGFFNILYDENNCPNDYLLIDANNALLKMFDLKVDDIIGNKISELNSFNESIYKYISEVITNQKTTGLDIYSKSIDRWLRINVIPIPVDNIIGCLFQDVTDTRKSEEKFLKSERRNSYLLELNNALRFIEDPNQVLVSASFILSEHLEASRVQYLLISNNSSSKNVDVIVTASHGRDMSPMKGKFQLLDLNIDPSDLVCVNADTNIDTASYTTRNEQNNSVSEVRARIYAPIMRNERLVAALVVNQNRPRNWTPYEVDIVVETAELSWDALERVAAREALIESNVALDMKIEERTRELMKSTAIYRMLAETADYGFWRTDEEGYIVEVNECQANLLGYDIDYLIGRHWSEFIEKRWSNILQSDQNNQSSDSNSRHQLMIERKDGSHIWVRVRGSPIIDDYGNYTGYLNIFTDVTEFKKAEERLKRSNEELEQFAYIASHDLREPLRMISSYLELLERRYDGKVLDDRAKQYIRFAVDGSLRMQLMIDDILTFSRINTTRAPLQNVDMNKVLATVTSDLEAMIEESGAKIFHEKLPVVVADRVQMTILLQNLISNAIKFRGDSPPEINISVELVGGDWIFKIKDNGIGIDPAHMDRLFQMFVRLHSRHEYEGTGIGLAICKKIVERHDGAIWVSSKLGVGSTFYFTLPVSRYDEMS